MTADYVKRTAFAEWLSSVSDHRETIMVSGGFRKPRGTSESGIPLFELNGLAANTVRILVPIKPHIRNRPLDPAAFIHNSGGWWDGWAAVLCATALVPPLVDARQLADLLYDSRRVRFCCDTNALCTGVAQWLVTLLNGRADIVTSAVVDRELAAWPDRNKGFWSATDTGGWQLRTHYRIAKRLTETPTPGVVVERLSPEQSALMLAKLRDETAAKSPDADMLLIELARGLVRDQPRNARIVYLTGDRNNARAATSALGSDNVLFAVADASVAKRSAGRVVGRGWWYPKGPLGAAAIPPLDSFLWHILSACNFIDLETTVGKWRICQATSIPNGVPSDWADVWFEIADLGAPSSLPSKADVVPETARVSEGLLTETNQLEYADRPVGQAAIDSRWLLPPISARPPIPVPASYRPTPKLILGMIWHTLSGQVSTEVAEYSSDLQREAQALLIAFEVMDASGQPGAGVERFRKAWFDCDIDWFHVTLLRHQGYAAAIEQLRSDPGQKLTERARAQIGMARALGQVARIMSGDHNLYVGDAPVSQLGLLEALKTWLPYVGDAVTTDILCAFAARDLALSPTRLELAIQRMWSLDSESMFVGRVGGTVSATPFESVAVFSQTGLGWRRVEPGALTFGGDFPVRIIERIR